MPKSGYTSQGNVRDCGHIINPEINAKRLSERHHIARALTGRSRFYRRRGKYRGKQGGDGPLRTTEDFSDEEKRTLLAKMEK